MIKILSNIGSIISAFIFAFCWHASLILVSLGLGSVAMGNWIKSHKEVFLAFAIFLMVLSLASAVRDKIKKGDKTGLIIFSITSVVTLSLLFYNKIMYGYFI